MTDQPKSGEQMRRQVMGDVFVDRALDNATEFTQPRPTAMPRGFNFVAF